MKTICFIGRLVSPFNKCDYDILKKKYKMILVDKDKMRGMKPYGQIWHIMKCVYKSDIVYSWFGGRNAAIATVFAKMFNKKVVIVAGGYDVVDMPEINYGAFTTFLGRLFSRTSIGHADLVLSVSSKNQKELLSKINVKKNILIHNGIPVDKFYPKYNRKNNIILTVSEVTKSTWKRKGLDNFVKVAEYFHSIGRHELFIVCGKVDDDMDKFLDEKIMPPNILWYGYVTDEELLKHYQRAKVYLQLSRHEGFGVSIVESMLCQCIPIVSDKIPKEIAPCGLTITNKYTMKDIESAIDKIFKSDKKWRISCEMHALKYFSLYDREQKLLIALKEL